RFYVWRPARHLTWTLLMDCVAYYPPGPTEVPRHLYRVGFGYRLRAAAMVGGLFTFLVLYLALIALASVIAFNLLMLPFDDVGITGIIFAVVVKFGGALAAGLFAVFLVKGLFKGQRVERAELIPLDEDDHPLFFAFVRRVYQDARSSAPRHVYVGAHVNASVIYNSSLLNPVIPPKKDLLIGLGLVNVVTLTEFKSILAHEFGHFPQRSVGLDTYLYVANRVMYDIIYKRDALDRFVDQWCELDVRISFPAWGLKAALSGVQRILGGLYRGLNMLHLSLSRQMEFNADNVAIRLAGSDALVHWLARMEFAGECLADAARSLSAAADHGLFSDDMFYHQSQAA